jgi:hypothetical protein
MISHQQLSHIQLPTGEDFTEAYARMIVCNQKLTPAFFRNTGEDVKDSQGDPHDSFFREGYQNTRHLYEECLKSREAFEKFMSNLNIDVVETILQYTNSANAAIDRKFCATKRRYLGWVPGAAAPGDIICIFLGAKAPYILRPDENDSNYYKFIGETYIHGIMQGEALKWDDISPQEFKIR